MRVKTRSLAAMIAAFITFLSHTGCASAQTTQPGGLSMQSSIDQILDALDRRGSDLHTLKATVKLTEIDPALGDSSSRSGTFWLENRADGSPRAHVLFTRKDIGDRAIEEKIEYVLVDGKIIDRNYAHKSQTTHQILGPGEKMNLLKLGEGPFPLPIGQKRADVLAAFEVSRVDAEKDDPADTVHILLAPKPQTSLARKFKSIDVWVNVHDEIPERIKTLNVNESEIRQTDLSKVEVNSPLSDADLTSPKIDLSGWNVSEDKFQNNPDLPHDPDPPPGK